MRAVRTSPADRLAAAWDLWVVRLLSRFSLAVPPVLVAVALGLLALGAGLFTLAAMHAFGDAAALAVRAVPGFFDGTAGGLTNGTHFVFVCAVPLLAGTALGLGQVFGLASADPVAARQDRAVWQGLGLSCGDVVLTHEVLPRLPVLAVAWTPVAALFTVGALTPAEHRLALLLLAVALAVEVLRLGLVAGRLSRPLERVVQPVGPAVRRLLGAALAGAVVGVAASALRPLWDARATDPVAARLGVWAVTHPAGVAIACVVAAVAGAVLLVRAVAADGGFRRLPDAARPAVRPAVGRATRAGFPVAGPGWLVQVWGAPELRWAVAAIVALATSGLDLSALPRQLVGILLVAALMAFCVTRLTSAGPSAGLMRLRHHVERGESPGRITVGLAAVAYAAAAPLLAAVLVLLVTAAGVGVGAALGVVLLAPIATLVADAVVARPGAGGLTETRLLILALLQSLLVMGGWLLFTVHPAAGWPLPLILTGVFAWLSPRRMTIWSPRTRP